MADLEAATPATENPMIDTCSARRLASTATTNLGQPRLAVLIPVFNNQEGLERSLASLTQDGSEFDVFVVDDGSEPHVRLPSDLPYRVRLLRQEPNQGITAALNKGAKCIAEAGYEYLARLDAGDLSLSGRFAAQMAFLDDHPEHAAVGTASRHVDTHGRLLYDFYPPTGHAEVMRTYRYRAGIIHAAVVMRTQALVACGFYREGFPGGEDYDLFMRMGKLYKLGNLDQMFIVVEMSRTSITAQRQSMLLCRLKLLVEHFDPWSIHSYLGIVSNLLFLLVPRRVVLNLRGLGERWRGTRAPRQPSSSSPSERRTSRPD
jgi:glycosyltransferase involved in cell wall biosynthesis